MKFKVGDEVAYIEDGGLVIGIVKRVVEDRREKDRFVDNLYAVNNQYKYESDLIPSPIAKIEERTGQLKRLQLKQDQLDKSEIRFSYAQAELENVLELLRGESK